MTIDQAAKAENTSEIKQRQLDTESVLHTVQDIECAVEAILFAAGYPISYEKLSEVIGIPLRDVKNIISALSKKYNHRGIQLLMFPDTCQICTKEAFAPYIREALGIKRGGNLSNSSMEVLAVVAYNQPVTRSYIDTIRGVDSSYAVTSLLDKGLIEAVGRLDAPGRPMLYSTTEKFLRVFGLDSLADLPETEALDAATVAQENRSNAERGAEDSAEQLTVALSEDGDLPAASENTVEPTPGEVV